MSSWIQTPSWVEQTRERALEQVRAKLVAHAGQHAAPQPVNRQTHLGLATSRAYSVFVEVIHMPTEPLSRRWWAWSRLHLGTEAAGEHIVLVEGWALTPAVAVRRVRDELIRQQLDYPFQPCAQPSPDQT